MRCPPEPGARERLCLALILAFLIAMLRPPVATYLHRHPGADRPHVHASVDRPVPRSGKRMSFRPVDAPRAAGGDAGVERAAGTGDLHFHLAATSHHVRVAPAVDAVRADSARPLLAANRARPGRGAVVAGHARSPPGRRA